MSTAEMLPWAPALVGLTDPRWRWHWVIRDAFYGILRTEHYVLTFYFEDVFAAAILYNLHTSRRDVELDDLLGPLVIAVERLVRERDTWPIRRWHEGPASA